jgi:undecaprenyl-diphosphatase
VVGRERDIDDEGTTTTVITAAPVGDHPVEIIEPDPERYVRAPGDVIRVVIAAALFVVTLLGAAILRSVISGAEADVVNLTSLVPSPVTAVFSAIAGTMGFLGPLAVGITLLFLRRLRVALMVIGAGVLAGLGMWAVSRALEVQVVLPANLGELRSIAYPGSRWIASAAAVVTVLNPWLPRSLRRIGVATVAVVALTRITSGQYVPYEVAVAVVLGWLVGVSLLAIFGSVNRRPSGRSIHHALVGAGFDVDRLELLGRGVRGSSVYRADVVDGRALFVKVFNSDQRDADLLVQLYRWVRLRDARDERPFSTLRRAAEHEALLSLKVHADGVSTARMLAVAEVEPDGMLIAFDYVDGESLQGMGPDRVTDGMLRDTWRMAAALDDHHIAHRDLRLEHVIGCPDGRLVLVDLGFGELAASSELRHTDSAELLVSSAIEVGAPRAVAAARDVVGVEGLAAFSPRVQPLALTSSTRRALSDHDGLLDDVQKELQQAAGLEEVKYEELARIKPRTVVTLVVLVIAFYALLPQIAQVSNISEQLSTAKWWWLIPIVFCLATTWFGATLGVVGSVPDRLPFFPMFTAQVAASFVDTLAPASVGGMALNTRFMQKRGVEPARAVAGVGLNVVAGAIVHVVMLGIFILWAGTSSATTETPINPPSTRTTLIVLGVIVFLVGGGWLIPRTRHLARTRGWPLVRDAAAGLRELVRKPRKLVALFGGSVVVTLGFYAALVCAVETFGGGPSPAQIGVAYLIAFAVAILAPTPGGLGALEVALVAGFQRLGMTAEAAFASVVIFRAGTFFLPMIPGYVTFAALQRRGDI